MLTFQSDGHVYRWHDKVVPSVSQIIAPLSDLSRIHPDVLEAKRRLGTAVHRACELDDFDRLDPASVHPRVLPYLNAWRSFRGLLEPQFVEIEEPCYHREFAYAGTPDRLAFMQGELWLLDLKSTVSVDPVAHGAQLGGYWLMKPAVRRKGVVRLGPTGRFQFVELPEHGKDAARFMQCLREWDHEHRNS